MIIREHIHIYLKSLQKYLSRLDKQDANEVIKEIESHILDVVDLQTESGQAVDIEIILSGFGPPRELASQYVDHILTGSPPPKGFNAIQQLKRGATRGLWAGMAIFGYTIAAFLGLITLMKVIFPNSLGVWSTSNGNSIVITFSAADFPQSTELLGWWLAPMSFIACILIFWLTKRVLTALKLSLT